MTRMYRDDTDESSIVRMIGDRELGDGLLRDSIPAPNLIADRNIGQILIDAGKLRSQDVEKVFSLHRKRKIRFGEAAVRLKLITHDDVRYALAVQFDYPTFPRGGRGRVDQLVVASDPDSETAESVRELRSELLNRWLDHDHDTLALVSASPGVGKSFLSANLAAAFAQLGERTLLIDADLRSPSQQEYFQLDNGAGLSTVLAGRHWTETIQPIAHFGNLGVMPAGPVPPNPLELLGRTEFRVLLDEVRRDYDVVLLDTPTAGRRADARMISARCGNALVVVKTHQDRLHELDQFCGAVREYGAQVVGAVMNL